jgi:hypothetical protein
MGATVGWNVVARVVVSSHLLPERRRSIKPTPRKHRVGNRGVSVQQPLGLNPNGVATLVGRQEEAGPGGPSGRGDMALAIRGLGAKSLEVPIAVVTSTLVLFSGVVRDMDKALHKGWISRQRNLFQKGSGTTKDGRLSFLFHFIIVMRTPGSTGRRLSNFQASHWIVQQAEPVGRTES